MFVKLVLVGSGGIEPPKGELKAYTANIIYKLGLNITLPIAPLICIYAISVCCGGSTPFDNQDSFQQSAYSALCIFPCSLCSIHDSIPLAFACNTLASLLCFVSVLRYIAHDAQRSIFVHKHELLLSSLRQPSLGLPRFSFVLRVSCARGG